MVDVAQVMVTHTIICKIHTSRLTTLVRNEVSCSCSCTKILAFLSMKLELLSPLLFVSPCLSSKRFFLFPIFDCPNFSKTQNRDPDFHNVLRAPPIAVIETFYSGGDIVKIRVSILGIGEIWTIENGKKKKSFGRETW